MHSLRQRAPCRTPLRALPTFLSTNATAVTSGSSAAPAAIPAPVPDTDVRDGPDVAGAMGGGAAALLAWWEIAALVVFRLVNSVVVTTSGPPDEFWQGPEVAHRLVFGVGELTWEWMPHSMLRGFAHPLLYVPLFWALKVTVRVVRGLSHRMRVAWFHVWPCVVSPPPLPPAVAATAAVAAAVRFPPARRD